MHPQIQTCWLNSKMIHNDMSIWEQGNYHSLSPSKQTNEQFSLFLIWRKRKIDHSFSSSQFRAWIPVFQSVFCWQLCGKEQWDSGE
jgi:hypothetical protein